METLFLIFSAIFGMYIFINRKVLMYRLTSKSLEKLGYKIVVVHGDIKHVMYYDDFKDADDAYIRLVNASNDEDSVKLYFNGKILKEKL